MQGIHKQKTGFRFGLHRLKVLSEVGRIVYLSRTYRIVLVETEKGEKYLSIRLYNERGKFIKQFLVEPEIAPKVGLLLAGGNPR